MASLANDARQHARKPQWVPWHGSLGHDIHVNDFRVTGRLAQCMFRFTVWGGFRFLRTGDDLGKLRGIDIAVVFIFAAMAPNVMRSSVDPAYSLTIQQAASADTTLLIMSVAAAVFVPGVLAYTIWSYKVFASRINVESINPDEGGLHPTLVRDSTQPEAHFGY